MKNLILILLLFSSIVSLSQNITRGPDIGEIYFLGPTYTGGGLYYSTDFGKTAVCVDSVNFMISIAADKTQGGVYSVTMPENLYYSDNYGYLNSWIFRNGEITDNIKSGVNDGFLFSGCVMHSEDYGMNFSYHSLNGFFGNPKNIAIDNADDNIGYVITNKLTVADTVYLFRTYDTFENLELIHKFNYHWSEYIELSRGFASGELYLINYTRNILWISFDYIDSFELANTFNFKYYTQIGIEGGNEAGELFILYNFANMMWQSIHIYIYHSIDYGKTFEVFHPFSKGIEPLLANFSTLTQEGTLPLTVEFCNYSIGDITKYEWDFDNNGTVDSYEESPAWVYADTGYYSVKLTIYDNYDTNTFLRENYIHVYDSSGTDIYFNDYFNQLYCYPNPFTNQIKITYPFIKETKTKELFIYDNSGKLVNILEPQINNNNNYEIIWEGTDKSGEQLSPGVYYCKLNSNKIKSKKILLTY